MCGGECINSVGYTVANMLYTIERLASCCAATAVVVCLITTLFTMLGLGVGLGYNYCVVDSKLRVEEMVTKDDETTIAATPATSPPIPLPPKLQGPLPSQSGRRRRRGFPSFVSRTTQDKLMPSSQEVLQPSDPEIRPTMVIPLQKHDLLYLILKLKKLNRNITLELINVQ